MGPAPAPQPRRGVPGAGGCRRDGARGPSALRRGHPRRRCRAEPSRAPPARTVPRRRRFEPRHRRHRAPPPIVGQPRRAASSPQGRIPLCPVSSSPPAVLTSARRREGERSRPVAVRRGAVMSGRGLRPPARVPAGGRHTSAPGGTARLGTARNGTERNGTAHPMAQHGTAHHGSA